MSFLLAESLNFTYTGHTEVLRDVSFSVDPGEHIALVGPNGCGKTTLFDILSGYRKPCCGVVYLEGRPVREFSVLERARKIALVPQASRIPFPYTCLETVLMGLSPFHSRFAPLGEKNLFRAEEVMRETGVWDFAEKNIQELSGGQAQRVIFTRALLQVRPETDVPPQTAAGSTGFKSEKRSDGARKYRGGVAGGTPPAWGVAEGPAGAQPRGDRSEGGLPPLNFKFSSRLFLLDEPFSELDIGSRIEMMKILNRYVRDYGITVIGIHHDLNAASMFARRIIALQNGRVVASGSPDEVFTENFFAAVFQVKAEIIPDKGFLFYDSLEGRGLSGCGLEET